MMQDMEMGRVRHRRARSWRLPPASAQAATADEL